MAIINEKYSTIIQDTVEQLSGGEHYLSPCFFKQNGQPLPSEKKLKEIVQLTRSVLFPGYFGNSRINAHTIRYSIGISTERIYELLCNQIHAGLCFECCYDEELFSGNRKKAQDLAASFIAKLPELRLSLETDVEATYNGDPAAESMGEVIYCYPAIRAISNYRIAYTLLNLNIPILPRIISEMAHSETGIDIHPGAKIGKSFTIDHGTGVVIGATAIIGERVKLYQGVTLGAKSFPLDEEGNPIKGIPRHPIIEDDVIIYSNATILGRITIGKGAVIGGNIWVTDNVPAGERIVQMPVKP
ncbi:MAG: serine acetyltransferase [Candidatus Azobacteroides sp.]|nr:serine acetyltransferase [Candidatus Azobacteroides sp.]